MTGGYSLGSQDFAGDRAGGRLGRHRFNSWGISDKVEKVYDRVEHARRPAAIGGDGKAAPPAVQNVPPKLYEEESCDGNGDGSSAPEGTEAILNTSGGWTRPSRAGWRLPPDAPLPGETGSGAGIAIESLTAKANKKGGSASAVGKIDSRDAAKKYGGKFI